MKFRFFTYFSSLVIFLSVMTGVQAKSVNELEDIVNSGKCKCTACDFENVNFHSMSFSIDLLDRCAMKNKSRVIDLAGSNFINSNFSNVNIHYDGVFRGVDFSNANMTNAEFENANLNGSNFTSANLQNTNFTNGSFARCNFSSANMTNAKLDYARFVGAMGGSMAWFKDTNLSNSSIMHAKMDGTYLNAANLSKAKIINSHFVSSQLDDANLSDATILYSDFNSASLPNANFTNTLFNHVNFEKANLKDAKWDNALLINVNFKGATIDLSELQDSQICQSVLPDGSPYNQNCQFDEDKLGHGSPA